MVGHVEGQLLGYDEYWTATAEYCSVENMADAPARLNIAALPPRAIRAALERRP